MSGPFEAAPAARALAVHRLGRVEYEDGLALMRTHVQAARGASQRRDGR